jgi:uncharacterized protein YutE (UPF0331/DUF86 family)
MVDKPKLDQMLSNLRTYVGVLRTLGALTEDAFLQNPDKVGNAKYHFVIGIECCIDVANHIIASENFRFPKDTADSFRVLGEYGVIGQTFAETLGAMARFRNRLVHLYWDVDDRLVLEYLRDSVRDLERFGEAIAAHEW